MYIYIYVGTCMILIDVRTQQHVPSIWSTQYNNKLISGDIGDALLLVFFCITNKSHVRHVPHPVLMVTPSPPRRSRFPLNSDNMGMTIINHPFGNGLYQLSMVIWGTVYYCYTHIIDIGLHNVKLKISNRNRK